MNNAQQKTLSRIQEKPTRGDIRWDELRSLLMALGAEIYQGGGSRVQFVLRSKVLRIHQPHPKKELKKYPVEAVRDFLVNTGIVE
jgi:hypothetical protein